MRFSELSQKTLWRSWYSALAWYSGRRKADFRCMNWGYDDGRVLVPVSEVERYCLQLYVALVEDVPLTGKTLVDASCGRGGGLAWLHQSKGTAQAIGVDYTPGNVKACEKAFTGVANLSFRQGDALRLPLAEQSADVVISVEASHCYGDIPAFFDAAQKVLRPGGWLCWTDFAPNSEVPVLDAALRERFEVVTERTITAEVLAAMAADGPRRQALVTQHSARFLHPILLAFAAADDSKDTVQRFKKGESTYFLRQARLR